MLPEENGDVGLAATAPRDVEHAVDERIVRRLNAHSIEAQEYKAHGEADALVSIHERMVLNDVKEIGSSFLVKRRMKILAREGRGWHGQGRFEQTAIADSERTAVAMDLVRVDCENFV
jgi:hypothetical protein